MPLSRVIQTILVLGLVVLLGVTTVRVVRSQQAPDSQGRASPAASASRLDPTVRPAAVARPEVHAARVLSAWDRRRAQAWEAGDVTRLAGLYAAGSGAGRHDVAMLRSWLDRGLRVGGLRTQVLALRVVEAGPRQLVVRVTDRLAGGWAVGEGLAGGDGRRLPADAPTTRTVTLAHAGGSWLVEEVSAEAGADDG